MSAKTNVWLQLCKNMPTSVRVGSYDFIIVQWRHVAAIASERLGEFSSTELVIRVDFRYPPPVCVGVLLHELHHAIYWAYGLTDSDGEERMCVALGNAWLQIWRDNPELLSWIGQASTCKCAVYE